MKNILNRIIKCSIYSLVFLLPLFWLPFSFEAFEFNKQYLLFFLASVSFLAWLAKMVIADKEIRFKRTPLDIVVLIFLLVAILSAIFSADKNSSLFGFYGRFSDGFIGLLCFGIMYFLITNSLFFNIQVSNLLKLFLYSVFLIVFIAYLSIFGVWQKLSILPQVIRSVVFNPVSGSLEGLAVFLSITTVFLATLMICQKEKSKQSIINLLLIALLGLLIIIDFNPAWIILALTLTLFLVFALVTRIFKKDVNQLLLPIFLIIISIIFLFLGSTSQWTRISLPVEQVLGQNTSWKIAFNAITDNFKNIFLGSGIGTWHYNFSKEKPIEFNERPWWQIRFDRSGSYISEILGTMGIFGFLSYLAIAGLFLLISWFLRKRIDLLPYTITFLAIFLGQLVYYQNTVLLFLFWFILGISAVSWKIQQKDKVFSFKNFPELNLVLTTVLISFFLLILGSYFLGIRFYLADTNYAKAQATSEMGKMISCLEKAVELNPKIATYQIILSRVYLVHLLEEIKSPAAGQNLAIIQDLVAKTVNQAKKTTEAFPNSVAAWETLAMIYRDIQGLASGTTEWSIKAFQKAIELEGKNPIFYTEVGKLYLASDNIQKAKESFAKAKEFKPDYIDALIQDVLIYERQNDLATAVAEMEAMLKKFPLNIDVKFQLGRLYFNQGKTKEAISHFEEIIKVVPEHSNTLYSLGLAYADIDEEQKAINLLEKVLELNPGNEDVIKSLEELKK